MSNKTKVTVLPQKETGPSKTPLIVAVIVVGVILALVFNVATGGESETVAEEPEQATEQSSEPTLDTTANEIKAGALDGSCFYEAEGEALFTVHGMYGSHLGAFASLGKRVFDGSECERFTYTLKVDTLDNRGNESTITAMVVGADKEKFNSYNWENLSGHTVYSQLKADGVIRSMNTVGVDTSKIRLGTVE